MAGAPTGASANETLLRVSLPRGFTGLTRWDRDRLCHRTKEFGGDSLGSAALSHVGPGAAPCRNTPGSPVLPKSSGETQILQTRRVLELDIFIFLRGLFPRGREVFFVPFETGLIYKGASPALVITH